MPSEFEVIENTAGRKTACRNTARRFALTAIAACITAGAATHAPRAHAQAAVQEARDYRIPAGPLASALSAFARDTGVTVAFRPEDTAGLTTGGLQGRYTATEGLTALLAGTRLRAVPQAREGFVIQGSPSSAPSAAATRAQVDIDNDPLQNAPTLEAITVSGDWLGTGLENSVQTFGGARTLVKRDEIQNSGATNIGDVLRRIPGVQISGSTSATGASVGLHVGIRGLNPRNSFRSTMLIDGIPLAMAPYGQPNLVMSPVSSGNLDSIDVVRGGGAVRYGPQNVGGIINFKTRAVPTTPGLTADGSLRYNAYGHGGTNRQYSAFAGTQTDYGLGVAVLYSGLDGQQWRDGSHDNYNDLAVKWRYEISPTSEVYGKFSHYDVKSMTPGGLTVAQYRQNPFQNTHPTDSWRGDRNQVDIGYVNSISDTQEFEIRSYYYESSRKSSLINPAQGRNDFQPRDNQVVGVEPRYTQRLQWGPTTHDVTIGYRYIHESGTDTRYATSLTTGNQIGVSQIFDNGTNAHSIYLDDRIAYDRWRITPGIRYEKINSDRQPSGTTDDTPFHVGNSRALPSLNVSYLVSDKFTLYTSYSTSFGAVQYTQLNSMSATNPLKPEVAKTVEIGGRYNGDQLHSELTLFDLRFDNQILSIPGTNPAVFRNLGATNHNGVEFAVDYDFDRSGFLAGLNLYANYTYVRAIQKSGEFDGNDVPFYSRQTATWGGRYTRQSWALNVFATVQSSQYSDTANTVQESADALNGRVPGFSVWNAQVSYKIPGRKNSDLAFGVNNLFDHRYYTRNVDTNGGRMVGAPRMFYVQARLAY
uniref:TonB-dependent siderophore receptor n=1 Tax=unclassified Cupriavidus TaxID=2640874 RepID=UPI00313B677D